MRAAIIGLSLAVAFLLGVVASSAPGPAAFAHEGAAPPARVWEGMCLDKDKGGVDQDWVNNDLYKSDGWNQAIMRYGAEGWELVQVIQGKEGEKITAVCFRRLR
ncbi:MAG: hypothetical protein H6744_19915 [Deltaproteobacteria bacterium]|nr:hypothetical protein [Deltaproteobacteria bacterium]MCB9788950.1 hypothetical protein [Deltaproteobacteria bacterium]